MRAEKDGKGTQLGPERLRARAIDRDPTARRTSSRRAAHHAADETPYTWPRPTERQHPNKSPCQGAIHTRSEDNAGRQAGARPRT